MTEENSNWLNLGLWLRGVGFSGMAVCGLLMTFGFFRSDIGLGLWMIAGLFVFSALMAAGLAILLAKVVKDRLENEEDDHYSKNVER